MAFAAMAIGAGIARAETVSNSYATFTGDRVGVTSGGDFYYDADGAGEIVVTAATGWLVNGADSITIYRDRERGRCLSFLSKQGEGSDACHVYPYVVTGDVHKEGTPVGISVSAASRHTAIYAVPDSGAMVSVPLQVKVESCGRHVQTRQWKPCMCGTVLRQDVEQREYEVEPDVFVVTCKEGDVAKPLEGSAWKGVMAKGKGQELALTVAGSRKDAPACKQCACRASANTTVDVYELSVSMDSEYLGLDMTDAGRGGRVTGKANAKIDPSPGVASYKWTDCGSRCSWDSPQTGSGIRFQTKSACGPSSCYREEPLVVVGTVYPNGTSGPKISAACTNRFTIVKVDVEIGGVDEDKEESEGAFLPYFADKDGSLTEEGKGKMSTVRLSCEPCLPEDEVVTMSCTGAGELYEVKANGELAKVTAVSCRADGIGSRIFKLHGHGSSESYKDGRITIEHPSSKAKDVAAYTSVRVNVEITDFPTKKLLGEDLEEDPGAFIPYAPDWAYGETESGEADEPFGLSARSKLVEVFISYEPSDLPEDEVGGGKFLEFEAPPDSLFLPSTSANADNGWLEFVNWWNERPANWSLVFAGKKRLLLHGHEKSKAPRDREIRITHPKSGATDVARYTVYHVDLDIDSDNDLSIEDDDGFEDAIEEREPGKIISYDQSGISPGRDYRVPLRLRAWGGGENAVVRLESSNPQAAEVYRSETGGDKVSLPFHFPADAIPALYVDGIAKGMVTFTATLISESSVELAEDKVAALIIQPISFAPGQGRHAGAWISDPCMSQRGNPNYAMRTANGIKNVAKSVGFACTEHEEWCVDPTDGYDDNPGDLTLARFKAMANCGLLLFKGHGSPGRNIPVTFTDTQQGQAAANAWCAGESGMLAGQVFLSYGTFHGVYCNSSWYAANWKSGLDQGNAIVFWQSCHSAERNGRTDSIEQSAGGRWRIAWGPSSDIEGTVSDSESASVVRGSLEIMAKEPSARPAELALVAGRSFLYGTCRTSGNPWTTLCPGPVPDGGCFPRGVLKKGESALGCMILDTFLDDTWSPEELLKTGDGALAEAGIAPVWLRQEGCEHPYGVRFEICKESDKAVEVTVSHQRVRNWGVNCKDAPFMKNGIEGVDDMMWEMSAPGRALDADGSAPNNSDLKWRY
ncbi:MAG: hypothetical protein ACI4QF_08090 [Kiritimatiellia bacterium]